MIGNRNRVDAFPRWKIQRPPWRPGRAQNLCLRAAVLLGISLNGCHAGNPRYSASANFSVDLAGDLDTRPNTWGTAGQAVWPVHFNVPQGYSVRILRVYGDFLIWPKGVVPRGKFAGALLSLHTSSPEKPVSTLTDLMVENCFLYVQLATGGRPERAAFDDRVSAGGLIDSSNTLYVKVAVWLNDTGLAIHMEPTWVTVFQVEDQSGRAVAVHGVTVLKNGKKSVPVLRSLR